MPIERAVIQVDRDEDEDEDEVQDSPEILAMIEQMEALAGSYQGFMKALNNEFESFGYRSGASMKDFYKAYLRAMESAGIDFDSQLAVDCIELADEVSPKAGVIKAARGAKGDQDLISMEHRFKTNQERQRAVAFLIKIIQGNI
jgi:hypothetical protein